MTDFADSGLGLERGKVRLVPVMDSWVDLGSRLARQILQAAPEAVSDVQHIGSTTVRGLLAKPIIDLAIAVRGGTTNDRLCERLAPLGWLFQGDAGDEGGWVFVLEGEPGNRVAHAHGVEPGAQWRRYLEFRDVLASSAAARNQYEAIKVELAQTFADDAERYTTGKDSIVRDLLISSDHKEL